MPYKCESSLVPPVASYTRRKGYRFQQLELPFYEHKIDLYGFSRTNNQTIAVELKLRRWRRAWEQALLYQLCADFAFIALPASVTRSVDLDLLIDNGIGMIAVGDSRCVQVIAPSPSTVVRSHYREAFVDSLMRSRG